MAPLRRIGALMAGRCLDSISVTDCNPLLSDSLKADCGHHDARSAAGTLIFWL